MLAEIIERRISKLLRLEMVRSLDKFTIALWGDIEEWKKTNVKAKLCGRVSYFENMPRVISGSNININISRVQQRSGTNQRPFDIPACKAFLITDYKEELEDMFDFESEIVTYKNLDELQRKVEYYSDESRRISIIEKGYEKVLAKHTYKHRMDEVINTIQWIQVEDEELTNPLNARPILWISEALIESGRFKEALKYLKIVSGTAIELKEDINLLLNKIQ
ncbi:MAG: hypothetical protein ACD_79C01525G0001 [uncultured bacterium]|nr:MAG: hypothetical protein ACD_79C01525G0001 [uncultured bacterium]